LHKLTEENIRNAAEAARRGPPIREDQRFVALREAQAGTPVMVHSPEGGDAFWLVPFLSGEQVCGYARVELDGRTGQISILGAGPEDRGSWIAYSFFVQPPDSFLEEIRKKHTGRSISSPVFSYDRSPTRWAWRLEVGETPEIVEVFITPAGWYEHRLGPEPGLREK